MTTAICIILIVAVAAVIAGPLLMAPKPLDAPQDASHERLEREKSAALLAIREAELDHAMGKLSDEDHVALRSFYERRALTAIEELNVAPRAEAAPSSCASCGAAIPQEFQRCERCGAEVTPPVDL